LPLDSADLDLELLAVLVPFLVDCSHQPTEPTIGQGQRLGEPGRVDVAWESVRQLFGRRAVSWCDRRLCRHCASSNSEITVWFVLAANANTRCAALVLPGIAEDPHDVRTTFRHSAWRSAERSTGFPYALAVAVTYICPPALRHPSLIHSLIFGHGRS